MFLCVITMRKKNLIIEGLSIRQIQSHTNNNTTFIKIFDTVQQKQNKNRMNNTKYPHYAIAGRSTFSSNNWYDYITISGGILAHSSLQHYGPVNVFL